MKIKKGYIAISLLILILMSGYIIKRQSQSKIGWKVSKDGIISFEYGEIDYSKGLYNENEYFIIEKIVYESKDAKIHGLLVTPYSDFQLPGVVLLPGAGVTKESELNLAATIASLGFIVLTIDQRGIGESKAEVRNLDQDFKYFIGGKEPFQHLMVYDALLGAKILNSLPGIEKNSIFIVGESLGGRNAMIAGAIDKSIKGVMAISSSGLGFKSGNEPEKDRFINSLDPDNYVGLISPRRFVMLHNVQDKIIPFTSAVETFKMAKESKNFYYVNESSCNHGYCEGMHTALKQSLFFLASQ